MGPPLASADGTDLVMHGFDLRELVDGTRFELVASSVARRGVGTVLLPEPFTPGGPHPCQRSPKAVCIATMRGVPVTGATTTQEIIELREADADTAARSVTRRGDGRLGAEPRLGKTGW